MATEPYVSCGIDFDASPPDLASEIAAEVMALPWTQGRDTDEHCWRYGEVQEAVARILMKRDVQ